MNEPSVESARTGPRALELTLEITTHCNLTCVMCPHGLTGGMPTKRHASEAIIDAFLERAPQYEMIRPTGVGEPLMAPGFWRIVDALAESRASKLAFVTNGILLTQANVDRLVRLRLGSINISVDAADEGTYRRIRGNEIRKTTAGIRRLVDGIATMPEEARPKTLTMSMVLMRENIEEAPAFVRMAHDLGVNHVFFEHLTDPHLDPKQWNVQRGNFQFNYAEQRLSLVPELSDAWMIKAMDVADELDMQIAGPHPLLLPQNQHHNERPCRYVEGFRHRKETVNA